MSPATVAAIVVSLAAGRTHAEIMAAAVARAVAGYKQRGASKV